MQMKSLTLFCLLQSCIFCALAAFDATIPVLDMQEFYHPATHDKFVREIGDAAREVGFFAVVNTRVDQQMLDRAYGSAEQFFRLPADVKMLYCKEELAGQRGYVPGEIAKGRKDKDFKEFFHVAREERSGGVAKGLPNIWPQEVQLRDPLIELFLSLEQHMVPIQQALAENLGLPKDTLNRMTTGGDSLLRAIHYPSHPPADSIWAGAHTDINFITILPRATADGLQVRNKQGQWVDVRVPDNAFVINIGDKLQNLTNGEFRSSQHRVVDPGKGQERFSMVLFIHPKPEDRLDPLPGSITRTGGVRRYPNATSQELLEERLVTLGLATDAMLQRIADARLVERYVEVGKGSPEVMQALKNKGLASAIVLAELEKASEN